MASKQVKPQVVSKIVPDNVNTHKYLYFFIYCVSKIPFLKDRYAVCRGFSVLLVTVLFRAFKSFATLRFQFVGGPWWALYYKLLGWRSLRVA